MENNREDIKELLKSLRNIEIKIVKMYKKLLDILAED